MHPAGLILTCQVFRRCFADAWQAIFDPHARAQPLVTICLPCGMVTRCRVMAHPLRRQYLRSVEASLFLCGHTRWCVGYGGASERCKAVHREARNRFFQPPTVRSCCCNFVACAASFRYADTSSRRSTLRHFTTWLLVTIGAARACAVITRASVTPGALCCSCGEFQCTPLGFSTAPGYDAVTGIGTVGDFEHLRALVINA